MCAPRRRTRKGRPRRSAPKTLPEDLYSYDDEPVATRQRHNSLLDAIDGENFSVTDDWPDDVTVTESVIEVFERWFGDVFDELLSPRKPKDSLPFLSRTDRKKA